MSKRSLFSLFLVALMSSTLVIVSCGDDDEDDATNNEKTEADAGDADDYNPCRENEVKNQECAAECVDLQNNNDHCGECDQSCPTTGLPDEAGCVQGECDCADDDLTFCEGTNTCTPLHNDPDNCGECGIECNTDEEVCYEDDCIPFDERLTIETNDYRERGDEITCVEESSDPVETVDELSAAAKVMSQELIDNNGQLESDPAALAEEEGYSGEVINAGPAFTETTLVERFYESDWIEADDPTMCQTLLNPDATDIGVGVVHGEIEDQEGNKIERYAWTVIMGTAE